MKEFWNTIQVIIAAIGGWLGYFLGGCDGLLIALVAFVAIDYITGMMAARKEAVEHPGDPNYGWSSKKGFNGIVKKVAIFAVITVAISLDYLIAVATAQLGMAPPQMAIFGLLVVVWFLLNEMLSIIENSGRMGADIPDWLTKYIAILKGKIDDQGGQTAD